MNLDTAEQKILHILQREGRISNVDLAERIGLSESPCFRRVRQLEENGLIQGYQPAWINANSVCRSPPTCI